VAADRERCPHKRENVPEQRVIGMIGWFRGDDILLDPFSAGTEVGGESVGVAGWCKVGRRSEEEEK